MTDCVVTPTADGRGICLRCDPEGRHPLFLGARRTCRAPAPRPGPAEIDRRVAMCRACDEVEAPGMQYLCRRDRCDCGQTQIVRMTARLILGTLPPCEKWAQPATS